MPNLLSQLQFPSSHSSIFPLEKQPKNLRFQSFFTSKTRFGGYFLGSMCTHFQKTCICTKKKHSRFSRETSKFLDPFLRFCLKKTKVKSKFSEFFTSKRPFGGYFQWNACTCFQKICSRRRYAKFFREISVSLVALLRFCFQKAT